MGCPVHSMILWRWPSRPLALPRLDATSSLLHDLVSDLVRIVAARKTHEYFSVLLADLLQFAVNVTRPANGKNHHGNVRSSDIRLEYRGGFVFPRLKPNQFLEAKSVLQRLLGGRSSKTSNEQCRPSVKDSSGLPNLRTWLLWNTFRLYWPTRQEAFDLLQHPLEAARSFVQVRHVIQDWQEQITKFDIARGQAIPDQLVKRDGDDVPVVVGPYAGPDRLQVVFNSSELSFLLLAALLCLFNF